MRRFRDAESWAIAAATFPLRWTLETLPRMVSRTVEVRGVTIWDSVAEEGKTARRRRLVDAVELLAREDPPRFRMLRAEVRAILVTVINPGQFLPATASLCVTAETLASVSPPYLAALLVEYAARIRILRQIGFPELSPTDARSVWLRTRRDQLAFLRGLDPARHPDTPAARARVEDELRRFGFL